jgi:hypothetical protein
MKSTVQLTLDTAVVAELGKMPRGKPSALVNAYLKNYFELTPKEEKKNDTDNAE